MPRTILSSSWHHLPPARCIVTLQTAQPLRTLFRQRTRPCISLVVDFLYACSSSSDQDRAVHRTSASSAVKSLRWLAKHIQWAALQACVHNSLVSSYCKQIASFDKREVTPIPAALVAAWERILCAPHTPLTTKLILGAALLCIHASIRFGDAQSAHWHTLQLSRGCT